MVNRWNLLQNSVGSSEAIVNDLKQLSVLALGLCYKVAASAAYMGFLYWLAISAAIFLIAVDQTNWTTNLQTGLLVPYIWINLPPLLFNFLRSEFWKWILLIVMGFKLILPHRFPEGAEIPASLIVVLLTAPSVLEGTYRDGAINGHLVSLAIAIYLLQEHIYNAGRSYNAFAARHGIPSTVGGILLFVCPVFEIIRAVCSW